MRGSGLKNKNRGIHKVTEDVTDNDIHKQKLSRGLKNRHIQLIAIGGAIGTGLFLGSGKSIHFAGPSILFAYLITGIICFFIMRSLGELLLSNLEYHSFVDFVRDYLGDMAALITGWTYWFCWISLAMADLTAVGLYTQYWLPDVPQWLPGLIALLILLIMNLATVKLFGELEFWFALIKVIAILALIVIGLFMIFKGFPTHSGAAAFHNLWNPGGTFPNGLHGFLLSFQMVVFAFLGIELVGLTAGETKDPEKVIPKAINNIPVRVLLFYIGALLVIMSIYPWNVINPNESPFVQVFAAVGIIAAASIINFVVLTSAASASNSAVFSTSRMIYSLAKEHNAPGAMTKLTSRKVPSNALFFSAVVILIGIMLNNIMPEQVFTLITSISDMLHLYLGNHRHLPFEIPQNKTGFSENKQIQDAALPVFKLCGSRFSYVYPHRPCTGAGHPRCLICHAGLVYHADRDLQAEET